MPEFTMTEKLLKKLIAGYQGPKNCFSVTVQVVPDLLKIDCRVKEAGFNPGSLTAIVYHAAYLFVYFHTRLDITKTEDIARCVGIAYVTYHSQKPEETRRTLTENLRLMDVGSEDEVNLYTAIGLAVLDAAKKMF